MNALPITSCGLRLDDRAVSIAVGLRLGLDLCAPHVCPCGVLVDSKGTHGLSCKRSFGRSTRHNILNDLVHRTLIRALVPSVREPAGLSRSDNKRPDGVSLTAWHRGKLLAWDVTVVDTLAQSYLPATSLCAGAAAEAAEVRKSAKYECLAQSHTFRALAFETMGPINRAGLEFFSELGAKLSAISGDPRETAFLLQRTSIIIQRGNATAFLGSFSSCHLHPDSRDR